MNTAYQAKAPSSPLAQPRKVLCALVFLFSIFLLNSSWHLESFFQGSYLSYLRDDDVQDCQQRAQVQRPPLVKGPRRPLRNQTGSWQGNTWVPPEDWRYFSTKELYHMFQNRSVAWWGDSTARRAAMTLYALVEQYPEHHINQTTSSASASLRYTPDADLNHPNVIDIGKKGRTQEPCTKWGTAPNATTLLPPAICRDMPGPGSQGKYFVSGTACTAGLIPIFEQELAGNITWTQESDIDIFVIALGVWEVARPWDCRVANHTVYQLVDKAIELLDRLQQQQPGLLIVWRTSGYMPDKPTPVDEMNEHVMDRIDQLEATYSRRGIRNNVTYVNWGGAVRPRSLGPERFNGDLKAHYSLEPRIVMAHMLANLLNDRSTEEGHHRSSSVLHAVLCPQPVS